MVEAAQDRDGDDGRCRSRRPHLSYRRGDCLPDALMRPRCIEGCAVRPEHPASLTLVQDEKVIEALTADTAEESLAHSICVRGSDGCAVLATCVDVVRRPDERGHHYYKESRRHPAVRMTTEASSGLHVARQKGPDSDGSHDRALQLARDDPVPGISIHAWSHVDPRHARKSGAQHPIDAVDR